MGSLIRHFFTFYGNIEKRKMWPVSVAMHCIINTPVAECGLKPPTIGLHSESFPSTANPHNLRLPQDLI